MVQEGKRQVVVVAHPPDAVIRDVVNALDLWLLGLYDRRAVSVIYSRESTMSRTMRLLGCHDRPPEVFAV